MKSGMIRGLAMLAVGIFMIYWAQTHSPKDFGKVIGNAVSGSYTMSEPWYYICLGVGILLGVVGVLRTYKSMK
ncbi:MAG: hypothetical protein JXR10_11500 [Cyclobacteriaceae bacterium]